MKTIARHFSALGGFFTYAKRHGMLEGDNPAHGFEFPRQGPRVYKHDTPLPLLLAEIAKVEWPELL